MLAPSPKPVNGNHEYGGLRKFGSCVALLFFTVAATIFTNASKDEDGSYPYNSFMVPCTVEVLKFCASAMLLTYARLRGEIQEISFESRQFATFALPALCYFVSNNCMMYIVRELGPTTFQVTSNLKIIATGVLMRIFMGRKLTWLRWKALVLLVIGSCVTQLQKVESDDRRSSNLGYVLVICSSFASGAGGVISEFLLKGQRGRVADPIHWQNMQLYFFGILLGLVSSWSKIANNHPYAGFNMWAYSAIISQALAGLLVSFILKYLDNFAKCFVAAVAIVCVALVQGAVHSEAPRLSLILGILLTCMALEQYNLPQNMTDS